MRCDKRDTTISEPRSETELSDQTDQLDDDILEQVAGGGVAELPVINPNPGPRRWRYWPDVD